MPFKKGNPGKPKGARNLINRSVEETAQRLGIDFFESLCLFAKGDWKALGYDNECYFSENAQGSTKMGYTISPDMRLDAIKTACKYLYTPRQAIALSTDEGGIKIIVEDYSSRNK